MEREALFLALAAMGITLAGFIGIVSTLDPRETWSTQDVRALRMILVTAFGAVLAGGLPVVSSLFVSTGEAVAFSSFILVPYLAFILNLERKDYGTPRWPILYYLSFLLPCATSIIIESINAFYWKSIAPHAAVTFWLLAVGCIQFSLVALSMRDQGEGTRGGTPPEVRSSPQATIDRPPGSGGERESQIENLEKRPHIKATAQDADVL